MTQLPLRVTESVARQSGVARTYWVLPLTLALVFSGVFGVWAHWSDRAERELTMQVLRADASSVEAQLALRKQSETMRLAEYARGITARGLPPQGDLERGLGIWSRVVLLDEDHRVVSVAEAPKTPLRTSDELEGQVDHLEAAVAAPAPHNGDWRLIARYEIGRLLDSTDLAWLNQRYEVAFVTPLGEVVSSTRHSGKQAMGEVFAFPLRSTKDLTLELIPHIAFAPWWRNSFHLYLIAGVMALGAAGSVLLRREMKQVSSAVHSAQSEAAWRQAMEDSALVGLRARDKDGRILYVNKTLCEMVGYSADELVGLIPPLPFWPADAVDALMARNMDTLAGVAPSTGFTTRWIHKAGYAVDVEIFESPLRNGRREHIGWMGSIINIGERRRLEEKEKQHTEALMQHARLNDLGLLASELAHELNQPLATVMGYSAGLEKALGKQGVSTDLILAAQKVQVHARKAGSIVNWIREQASRTTPIKSPHAMSSIVQEVRGRTERQQAFRGIQIDSHVAVDLPLIVMDRIGMEQVLWNLLKNAADAMAETKGDRTIEVGVMPDELEGGRLQCVKVSVADRGPGLGGKSIDEMCAAFYSTKTKGMGLGLGICRSIIEAHGGELQALEREGGGAVISFSLSIAPEEKH